MLLLNQVHTNEHYLQWREPFGSVFQGWLDICLFKNFYFLTCFAEESLSGFGESLLHNSGWKAVSLFYYRINPISLHPMKAKCKERQWPRFSLSDPLTQNFESQVGDLAWRQHSPAEGWAPQGLHLVVAELCSSDGGKVLPGLFLLSSLSHLLPVSWSWPFTFSF